MKTTSMLKKMVLVAAFAACPLVKADAAAAAATPGFLSNAWTTVSSAPTEVYGWAKNNPYLATYTAATTAALVYLAYKAYNANQTKAVKPAAVR